MMRFLDARGLASGLLAVALALGAAVFAVQAGGMAADMALSPQMDSPGHACCDPCPDGYDGPLANCMMACTVTGFAVLSNTAPATATRAADGALPFGPASRGRSVPPDPVPPRSDRLA